MTIGYIILRHVSSRVTNLYWQECYRCIRRVAPVAPVMIVDDSSQKEWLTEDIQLTNCTVIYDREHRGAGELLPYYYFHLLRPFDQAIIVHDSAFLHQAIIVPEEPIVKLWSITHRFNGDLTDKIQELIRCLKPAMVGELLSMYPYYSNWSGIFGCMSIVKLSWIQEVEERYGLFRMLPLLTSRDHRSALERVLGLIAHHHAPPISCLLGDIHEYLRWGITFGEYITRPDVFQDRILMKVWTGR